MNKSFKSYGMVLIPIDKIYVHIEQLFFNVFFWNHFCKGECGEIYCDLPKKLYIELVFEILIC